MARSQVTRFGPNKKMLKKCNVKTIFNKTDIISTIKQPNCDDLKLIKNPIFIYTNEYYM